MPGTSLESEHRKLLNRKEELLKQEVSLKKDYTTLLRKIASVCQVLEALEDVDGDGSVFEYRVPVYEKFKEWESIWPLLKQVEEMEATELSEVEVPENLRDSYELFKRTPLLYKDTTE